MTVYTPDDRFTSIFDGGEHGQTCMKVFDMFMNGLGIPEIYHEYVRGVFLAGNWEMTSEGEKITYNRMARALTPSEDELRPVYHRLRRNGPKFKQWQESSGVHIIDITPQYRDASILNFLPYVVITNIFKSITPDTTHKQLRERVKNSCKRYLMEKDITLRVPAKRRGRRPDSVARTAMKALEGAFIEAKRLGLADQSALIAVFTEMVEGSPELQSLVKFLPTNITTSTT